MIRRLLFTWIPRVLFRLALVAASLLIALVLAAPWLDDEELKPEGWGRVLALFARDAALRRTAVASALGLTVTACIFFRGHETPVFLRPLRRPKPPPPSGVAGA